MHIYTESYFHQVYLLYGPRWRISLKYRLVKASYNFTTYLKKKIINEDLASSWYQVTYKTHNEKNNLGCTKRFKIQLQFFLVHLDHIIIYSLSFLRLITKSELRDFECHFTILWFILKYDKILRFLRSFLLSYFKAKMGHYINMRIYLHLLYKKPKHILRTVNNFRTVPQYHIPGLHILAGTE